MKVMEKAMERIKNMKPDVEKCWKILKTINMMRT